MNIETLSRQRHADMKKIQNKIISVFLFSVSILYVLSKSKFVTPNILIKCSGSELRNMTMDVHLLLKDVWDTSEVSDHATFKLPFLYLYPV